MKTLIAGLALLLGTMGAQAAPRPGGRYGTVELLPPTGTMRGFVVLFSGQPGWQPTDQRAAAALAAQGALVVGVDTGIYAAKLAAMPEHCHNLIGDAESAGRQLEREFDAPQYFRPILAGAGQGGALARQVLAEAPSNTFLGAAAVDPAAGIDPRFNVCAPDAAFLRGPGLPGFWEVGHSPDAARMPAVLGALVAPHLHAAAAADGADVSDLPLIELRAAQSTDKLAIVISGDGGWRDLDKTIGQDLQKSGVSVVGWDSLRWFWRRKTPDQVAEALARILRHYGNTWGARNVALVGYSFGADILPFAYNRLPPDLRGRVALMSLLGFEPKADFEIQVSGWLGLPPSSQALDVRPEIAKVPPGIVQCFYGADEDDSDCPRLQGTGAHLVRTEGGHHFGGDYAALARDILAAWNGAARPAAAPR